MAGLVTTAQKDDTTAIFEDDSIVIFLESPERSFFKIAVNSAGVVWDESEDSTMVERDTLPVLWNPGIKAVVQKQKEGWTAEIAIPTADLGNVTLGPKKLHPWGINVCRQREAGEQPEFSAISPTGKAQFSVLTKLGSLTMP